MQHLIDLPAKDLLVTTYSSPPKPRARHSQTGVIEAAVRAELPKPPTAEE